jgi:hypothetical protein
MANYPKLTKFFQKTSNEVHEAAIAANSGKYKMTLLQQMAASRAKKVASDKAKADELAKQIALRKATEAVERRAAAKAESVEKAIRDQIDLTAAGKNEVLMEM